MSDRVLQEPGRYVCEKHPNESTTMYIRSVKCWCKCGAPMKFDRPLNKEELRDIEVDERRAVRDELRLKESLGE